MATHISPEEEVENTHLDTGWEKELDILPSIHRSREGGKFLDAHVKQADFQRSKAEPIPPIIILIMGWLEITSLAIIIMS